MKAFARLFSLFSFVFLITSCATIFGASTYQVSFNTTPDGAKITIEDFNGKVIFEGETPTSVMLRSAAGYMTKEQYKITFSKKGYANKVVTINTKLNGWYIGNVLIGGFIGMLIVDPVSGAMFTIPQEDRTINETLQRTTEHALQVYDINDLPDRINKKDLIQIG